MLIKTFTSNHLVVITDTCLSTLHTTYALSLLLTLYIVCRSLTGLRIAQTTVLPTFCTGLVQCSRRYFRPVNTATSDPPHRARSTWTDTLIQLGLDDVCMVYYNVRNKIHAMRLAIRYMTKGNVSFRPYIDKHLHFKNSAAETGDTFLENKMSWLPGLGCPGVK